MSPLFSKLDSYSSSWTLPGGLSAADDDDQERLQRFLKFAAENPMVGEIVKASIERATQASAASTRTAQPNDAQVSDACEALEPYPDNPVDDLPRSAASSMDPPPPNAMRISEAVALMERLAASKEVSERAAYEQCRQLKLLGAFLEADPNFRGLGKDPWIHQIGTHHVLAFMRSLTERKGRHVDEKGNSKPLRGKTLLKRLTDLSCLFARMEEEEACHANPAQGLSKYRAHLRSKDDKGSGRYWPFTDQQFEIIFEPKSYLADTRTPDYFWPALFSAHTGVRLSEIVVRKVGDVLQDKDGLWYLFIEKGKTTNSIRCVPITQPLINLGFLEYVEHVRALGGDQLFANCDFTSKTARQKPTKNQTEGFSELLDKRGLVNPRLVFHSFRHTVVNALLDSGTPVHISMQICGHEAQSEAISRGLITEQQARSVHLSHYMHADMPRLGRANPLLEMKKALEASVKLPLDYARLSTAAEIVKEHVRREGERIVAGWPPQRVEYTDALLARLDAMGN